MVDLETDRVKVRVIHIYDDIKIILILISGRIVADLFALRIFSFQFGTALVNVQLAAGYLGVIQYVRICLSQIAGGCH